LAGLTAAAHAASAPLPVNGTSTRLVHGIDPAPGGTAGAAASDEPLPSTSGPGDWQAATRDVSSYAPAEALLARALEERERTLGKDDPFTLTTVNSLAAVYTAQGRYRDAELLYKRALEASERTLGKEHSLTQAAIKGLASVYKAEGRYDEAQLLYSRASKSGTQSPYN
jgi:tetratricopeptide (TPR) repeat protein